MNKSILLFCVFIGGVSWAQSYAPEPGVEGSTAVHKDSSIILSWAYACDVDRGLLNIDDPSLGEADFGDVLAAVGKAEGNTADVLSLGDGGVATLYFNPSIANGPGPDFAVFENGFADHYMELAFVEVSSNGQDFYRFPASSETPENPQLNNGSFSDCRYVHNLAGKYRQGYGTPFDLQELDSIPGLDLQTITHVRIIDVVGKVGVNGSQDQWGRYINDPFPTPFASGGFDLDGIGVMNEGPLNLEEYKEEVSVNNPFSETLHISLSQTKQIQVVNLYGVSMFESPENVSEMIIETGQWPEGVYLLKVETNSGLKSTRLLRHL